MVEEVENSGGGLSIKVYTNLLSQISEGNAKIDK